MASKIRWGIRYGGFLPILFLLAVTAWGQSSGVVPNFSAADPATPSASSVVTRVPCASVTFVMGSPLLISTDGTNNPIVSGQKLSAGDQIRTDASSRLELTCETGAVVRLDRESVAYLGRRPGSGSATGGKQDQLFLSSGQGWFNFSATSGADAPQVLTARALFKSPGGIFCLMVTGEGASEAKVYRGQLNAKGPYDVVKEDGGFMLYEIADGQSGSAAVSAWFHQVDAYRKLIVLDTGKATPAFRFAARSDATEWVLWNQKRDAAP